MTTASFAVIISNDNVYEESEMFDVDINSNLLPNRVSPGSISSATVTIIDFGKLLFYKPLI